MYLKHFANELVETLNDGLNLLVKQKFNKFEDVADISNDDLEGYRALRETFDSYCTYVTEQAEKTDDMVRMLEKIQEELKDMNGRLKDLEGK